MLAAGWFATTPARTSCARARVPACPPARRPNKVPRRLPACSSGLGAAPPPSKPRHSAANRLFSAACPPNRLRPNKSPHAHQPSARALSRATSLQDPPPRRPRRAPVCAPARRPNRAPRRLPACSSGPGRATSSKIRHHAVNRLLYACARVHARPRPRPRATPEQGASAPASLQHGPLGRATSFQDPPPCGKPAAFRSVPASHSSPPPWNGCSRPGM